MKTVYVIAVFCVFVASLRLVELFWLAKDKQKGRIFSRWSIFGLSSAYVLLLGGAGIEFVISGKGLYLPLSIAGMILMCARAGLKIWAAKTLSKYWSFHIEIRENHELIIEGPYKYIRHPAYLSAIMDAIGIVLFFNAGYSAAIFIPIMLFLLFIRISEEERQLLLKFGEQYKEYKQQTDSMIPFRQLGVGKS